MDPEQTAVAVKSATGVYTAIGAIGTFIASLIGLIVAWVKFGPKWKEMGIGERGRDLSALDARITKLEADVVAADRRAGEANERAHNAETQAVETAASFNIRLMSALNACRLLLGVVEREAPDSTELTLAKDLLAMAATDDMGIGIGIRKIVRKVAGE